MIYQSKFMYIYSLMSIKHHLIIYQVREQSNPKLMSLYLQKKGIESFEVGGKGEKDEKRNQEAFIEKIDNNIFLIQPIKKSSYCDVQQKRFSGIKKAKNGMDVYCICVG